MTVLDQKSVFGATKKVGTPVSHDLLSPATLESLRQGGINETLNQGHKQTFLDHMIFGLLGTPDSMLDSKQLGERQQARSEAGADANRASQNPGEDYMWAPNPGGSGGGLGDILKTVMKVVGAVV